MAGLEQFHQCKSHDETDGTPFEASQNGLKHPAQTLAQATTALKRALDLGAAHTQRPRASAERAIPQSKALNVPLRCQLRRSKLRRRGTHFELARLLLTGSRLRL